MGMLAEMSLFAGVELSKMNVDEMKTAFRACKYDDSTKGEFTDKKILEIMKSMTGGDVEKK